MDGTFYDNLFFTTMDNFTVVQSTPVLMEVIFTTEYIIFFLIFLIMFTAGMLPRLCFLDIPSNL